MKNLSETRGLASILVVEDEAELRRIIQKTLSKSSFSVTSVGTGRDVVEMTRKGLHDLVILDLMLPDADGLDLARRIKAESNAAVIILSSLGETTDRIIGLEAGADDYLAKPFDPRELLARVRSVLRRPNREKTSTESAGDVTYIFGRWQLESATRELKELGGEPVSLTGGEFDLLLALVQNPGRVLTRDQLMDTLHGIDTPAFERSIDVRIGRLRKKIEADSNQPSVIKTIRNVGYMFTAKVSADNA